MFINGKTGDTIIGIGQDGAYIAFFVFNDFFSLKICCKVLAGSKMALTGNSYLRKE